MKLPQLTLRELFLLVALAATGCGWWVDRTGLRRQLQEANATLEEAVKDALIRASSY